MTEELNALTNSELKALCKDKGLEGYSQLNKSALVNLLLAETAEPQPELSPAPKKDAKLKKGSATKRPPAPSLDADLQFADDAEKDAWITEAYQHSLLREPHAQELAHYREQIQVGRALYRIIEVLNESAEGQNKSVELGEVATDRGAPSELLPKVAEEEE